MSLKKIDLQNYRTYTHIQVDLGEKTILIGDNAQGKTNFLESIYYLSFGKSFRSADKDIIKWNEEYFRIEALNSENKKVEIFFGINPQMKSLKINNQSQKQSDLFGFNYSVLFEPEDINLIFDAPEKRRRFLDKIISQIDKKYLYYLINYKKILKQRNQLLFNIKEGKGNLKELEIWSEKLVDKGIEIVKKRFEFFAEFEGNLKNIYLNFDNKNLWLKYNNSVNASRDNFLNILKKNESMDLVSGKTSVGPHRDDYTFYLDDKKIMNVGSRGECRSAILALKVAEIRYIELKTDKKPIFLLDDVFSELDNNRKKILFSLIDDYQYIITSININNLNEEMINKARILKVDKGFIING